MTMKEQLILSVARDFSATPGPRNKEEGKFSGEQFLEVCLEPRFLEARRQGLTLLVQLDNTAGFATSFLEAAFGGLARKYGADVVRSTLRYESSEEPYLIDEIEEYVTEVAQRAAG